ncbi:MAG: flagellar hook-associated protein 3 [Planctomycetota bacterium]|nr:MAG: flagellar hook-associated protein 3 [Planctomycetota bacterium]
MSGILSNIHGNISFALNLHYKEMARLQEQAYTGSRINRASDEPSTAYLVLGLNSQKRTIANYMDNITDTMSSLDIASTTVSNMVESISSAKVALAGVTDTDGTVARSIYPETINNLLEDLVLSANWQHKRQYLFGGSDTDSAPYAITRDSNGDITEVAYQGSLEDRDIEVAPNVESSAFYAGDNVFRSNDRGDPEFVLDNTGAAAGTGTASVTGYTWLTVAAAVNEQQTITITGGPPTSGDINIAFGGDNVDVAFDADADAVRAAMESMSSIGVGDVTVTGTSFTDANGITVEFTGALALTNVAEMVVADVDLDAGTPAISTDRDGGMQLSIDGGTAVGIPIGDKTNVAVTNPDGKVLYVDATNITSTGVDLVNIPGTHDMFNTLITIRDILKNENDTFTSGQLNTMRDNSTEALDELSGLLSEMTVSLGTRIGFLQTIKDNLEDMKFGVEDEATLLQEADIAQIAIDISRRQALYEMSLSVSGRLMSMSLLDFIR